VRGVGSGSLNTMRQVGFTVGVALLVAVFTHTVAQNARQATRTSLGVIAAQPQLSAAEKGAYAKTLVENARSAAGSGSGAATMTTDPLEGAPEIPGSSAATLARLTTVVTGIYRHDIAKSFTRPFFAAALAALAAIIPALLTGRRLGEHEGHHKMTRSERLEAADRTEAAEAGPPPEEGRG
jgi:hypothetical protein